MDTLDNANVIAQRDVSDALGLAAETPKQLLHTFDVPAAQPKAEIHNVVFSGMGGSSLQAELMKTWPELRVPFFVSKDYNVPAFVDEHTLFIAASYSGNTEETIAALAAARERGAQIAVSAAGGKLLEIAKQQGDVYVEIPRASQPRMAVLYAFRAGVELLVAHGLVSMETLDGLSSVVGHLERAVASWKKDVPTENNAAKQLAITIAGKTPIIYSGPLMTPAAYKWKISFNENAKNTAWCNTLPEFNHNEFIGWSSHPVEKPFAVIDLVSRFEHERTIKRFDVTDRLLSGMRPKAHRVDAVGDSPLEHMLYLVLFGDFVTLYTGLLNGVDPTPVELVEKFKRELGYDY